jgi:hypothetical protein
MTPILDADQQSRTDTFLAIARVVEADALPAPRDISIYRSGGLINMTFDDLESGRAWAEHFALRVSSSGLLSEDGRRLIYTWWRNDVLGANLWVNAYPPVPDSEQVARAALAPDSLPERSAIANTEEIADDLDVGDRVPLPIGVEGHAIVGGRTR